ncbi:MAG: response regulator transcription factor [Magnetococcales bacterium]|nr:response regulator transcription factor [Magnetococcales bacterium]
MFCSMLSKYLDGEGFVCEMVHDGSAALAKASGFDYDAVVLDVMMPKINGFEVVRKLRAIKQTPILMLTARGDENESIIGLEIGADDYLTKPCNPKLLAARLRAVLRRTENGSQPTILADHITVGDIVIHPGSRQVGVGKRSINLTSSEFNLLELLARSAGEIVLKETLSLKGMKRKLLPFDRSIDFHISSLRRKLGPGPNNKPRIITIRGEGYLLSIPQES